MRKQIHQMFQGLMFLHGHVVLPERRDADFAPLGNRNASARWFEGDKPAREHAQPPAAGPVSNAACASC